MKAGGALLHQPFPLLVPFAPECRNKATSPGPRDGDADAL